MMKHLRAFFARVTDTHKGLIVPEELYRAIVTALGSGGVIGLALMILGSILSNAETIFPDPAVASLATLSLTLVIDLLRRQNQGGGPPPGPAAEAMPPAG